MSLAVVTELCI